MKWFSWTPFLHVWLSDPSCFHFVARLLHYGVFFIFGEGKERTWRCELTLTFGPNFCSRFNKQELVRWLSLIARGLANVGEHVDCQWVEYLCHNLIFPVINTSSSLTLHVFYTWKSTVFLCVLTDKAWRWEGAREIDAIQALEKPTVWLRGQDKYILKRKLYKAVFNDLIKCSVLWSLF